MSTPLSFDDALDAAIDALRAGATREQALTAAGGHAAGLAGLLETADALVPAPVPAPSLLGDHYTIVRAAVERAQMTRTEMIPAEPAPSGRWWKRRLGIASLSIPAGLAALMLAGAAAAAGGVAVSGVGQEIADSVRPGWVSDMVGSDNAEDAPGNAGQHGSGDGNGVPGNAGQGGEGTPGSENAPQFISVSGTVSDINGNTFTLTSGEDAWLVQVDAVTVLTGEILDGAAAEVEGDITAEKNLHATSIVATGGTPAAPPGNQPEDPGQSGDPGRPEDAGTDPPGQKPATPPSSDQGGPER